MQKNIFLFYIAFEKNNLKIQECSKKAQTPTTPTIHRYQYNAQKRKFIIKPMDNQ